MMGSSHQSYRSRMKAHSSREEGYIVRLPFRIGVSCRRATSGSLGSGDPEGAVRGLPYKSDSNCPSPEPRRPIGVITRNR